MIKQNRLFLFWSFVGLIYSSMTIAQAPYEHFVLNNHLQVPMDSQRSSQLFEAANELIGEIKNGKINVDRIHSKYKALTQSIWSNFKNFTQSIPGQLNNEYIMQLMKVYPLGPEQYMLSMAIAGKPSLNNLELRTWLDIVAEKVNGVLVFSTPLLHRTKTWQSRQVGDITYHFRDEIKLARAEEFNRKNTAIAGKLNVEPEQLEFFMTDNYQEFLNLVGIPYAFDENGKYRDGYGVDGGCIFAIMSNEDFSHDIFHYYSSKVNERMNRNWIAEEGVAYSWGNAYYTDESGEMINQDRLVLALKDYLVVNPTTNLYELFEANAHPFGGIAPEVSMRSLLSSLICDKIESEYGMAGLLKLINCGRKDKFKQYFSVTNELLGLNRNNFNDQLTVMIQNYK